MKKQIINLWFLVSVALAVSCNPDPDADVADVNLSLDFFRADSLMFAASEVMVKGSEKDYMKVYETFFRPEKEFFYQWIGLDEMFAGRALTEAQADSLIAQNIGPLLADPNIHHLLDTVQQVFPYDYPFVEKITPPLKRLVKYIPDVEIPVFRTHVNGYIPEGDLRSADQMIFLGKYFSFGLHYFLGPDLKYYPVNIPKYQKIRFSPEYLDVMMVREIAEGMVSTVDLSNQPTLLDQIIREGIKQYFIHQLLPHTPDSMLLLYSARQMEWANYYEARIYKELSDDLYSIDFLVHRDFLTDKPYTTTLSLESAPRLGEFLGWKIVSSYMEKNKAETLADLIERKDYESIFKAARYKPLSFEPVD
ncbi:MAG: hypothetical protein SF052_16855 [Bacteroidia bacterium]|nr:hypothetical protein [Bacteroidia bacterium]